jgi:pimeloyl-ACP methyl ester carboxylesterase
VKITMALSKLVFRILRWLLILMPLRGAAQDAPAQELLLGPFEKPRPRELTIPQGADNFDAYEALHGSFSSPDQCARVPNGLWVEVDGAGDCVRYYAHGLEADRNEKVLVYFSGDVMLRTSKGARRISASYHQQSPATILRDMAEWSMEGKVAAIYLARPGIYGSSGDHNMRRHPRELALMNRALDLIKTRHNVSFFILAGHSGGGHVVASLLNRRRDILGAAISSGIVSTTQVARFWEKRRKIRGSLLYDADKFYDPVTEVDQISQDPKPRIFVISDPEDRVVPFFSQLYYVRRLRRAGLDPHHFYAHAPGPQRHLLFQHARLAAAMMAHERTTKEIIRALDELDLEQLD